MDIGYRILFSVPLCLLGLSLVTSLYSIGVHPFIDLQGLVIKTTLGSLVPQLASSSHHIIALLASLLLSSGLSIALRAAYFNGALALSLYALAVANPFYDASKRSTAIFSSLIVAAGILWKLSRSQSK